MPLWHNIAELMDYYIPPMPSVYWLDITRECNLRCIMCPHAKGLRPRQPRMSAEMYRAIVDDVCGNGPLIKLYLSGEPLLHPDLVGMIEYAAAKGCSTMVHTNATLLTEQMSRSILSSPLSFLCFSFDGGSREVYERLRPPAQFEQVRANILRFLCLRGSSVNPRTTIEIIRMRETNDLLDRFVVEWKANGIDDVHIAEFLTWHGLVEDRGVHAAPALPAYKPCAAPFRHGCILSDGTVVPCCVDVNGRIPLGNVGRRRFSELWQGGDFRRLRLQMLSGSFVPGSICDRCDNVIRSR